MRVVQLVFLAASFAVGWAAGCGTSNSSAPSPDGGVPDGGATACPSCVTDKDCHGLVCAQFGGDTYCASSCSAPADCASDRVCELLTTATGDQVSVCIPRGDVCGPAVGPPSPDAGSPGGTCGTLVGPDVTASCHSCGTTHACQPNGCYGGWWCDTASTRCQAPPAGCAGAVDGGDGGSTSSGGAYDAGGPVTGQVGPDGGTLSRLFFAVVGDTRPATIDDTSGYPTAIITKIYDDLAAMNPVPAFVLSTGDYVFAAANGTQAGPQADLYLAARGRFPNVAFPALGNHECTGYTASNCGAGAVDGLPVNYTTFMAKFLAPLGKTTPYFVVNVNATDTSWTSKFVFIAANAWNADQATWLDTTLALPTTYTFVVRHEPAFASTAPGVTPSEQIMAKYPYTLAIVGHTHTYGKTGAKQVTIGNGGAPITSGGANYGFAVLSQRPDNAIVVDMIDYQSGLSDTSFRFAVKPDGTAAP